MPQPPWDPEKARLNFAKHGVSFDDASHAIKHPLARQWPDIEHSDAEDRWVVMGWSPLGILVVVVVSIGRDGNMRIISARRATKRERHAYEDL
jgi:uncharacterized protein